MSGKLNYERVARQERLTFKPSWRSLPATQKQVDYILALARQKGQPKPKLPKTKHGASELIERLLAMPAKEGLPIPPEPVSPVRNEARVELATELREKFPVLTPMMTSSLTQLFIAVDELGAYLFFEGLSSADSPEEPEDLIPWILQQFLDWLV